MNKIITVNGKITLDLLSKLCTHYKTITIKTNIEYSLNYLKPYYNILRTGYSSKSKQYFFVLEKKKASFTEYLTDLLDKTSNEELREYFTTNFTKDAEEYKESNYSMLYQNKKLVSVKVGSLQFKF